MREMTEPVNVTIDIASYGMPAREFIQWLRGGLGGEFEKVADDIEEQVKPAIDEPPGWGSVVLGRSDHQAKRVRWVRAAPGPGWYSEHGAFVGGFQMLFDVEVLRVGIGPEPLAQWETELLQSQERRDIAAAVLGAMDVDQYLIDAVVNARPR